MPARQASAYIRNAWELLALKPLYSYCLGAPGGRAGVVGQAPIGAFISVPNGPRPLTPFGPILFVPNGLSDHFRYAQMRSRSTPVDPNDRKLSNHYIHSV